MTVGNLATGGFMVLAVIVVTLLVAFIQEGTTTAAAEFTRCEGGNYTSCEPTTSSGAFVDAVFDVAISGLDGAPTIFNVLYVLLVGGVFALGLALLVAGIIGTPLGGG